jgi:hypothetical protein
MRFQDAGGSKILFRFQDVDDSFKTLMTILRRRYFWLQDVNDGFKTPKCATKMSALRSATSKVSA